MALPDGVGDVSQPGESARHDRLAVYTVVYGQGFVLPPTFPADGVDYICFTDQHELTGPGWDVHVVDPILPADLPRSSREQKIRPHRWLPDHDRSIYIDVSVELTADPNELWHYLVGEGGKTAFGALHLTLFATLLEEFVSVSASGNDSRRKVHEHLEMLEARDPGILYSRPVWGGMLARRHHEPECVEAMESWFAHVLRYSRRDQLSLPSALTLIPAALLRITPADLRQSPFHRWPIEGYRKPEGYQSTGALELGSLTEGVPSDLERFLIIGERDDALRRLALIEGTRSWRAAKQLSRVKNRTLGAARRYRRSSASSPLCVSYPKSGRTWLRLLMSELGVDMEFTHLNAGHDEPAWATLPAELEAPVFDADRRYVFLHRDPRDTVVSFYYETLHRQLPKITPQRFEFLAASGRLPPTDMNAFVRDPRFGLDRCVTFNLQCLEEARGRDQVMTVSYEELRAEPARVIDQLLRHVGQPRATADIQRAVRACDFDAVRQMELDDTVPETMADRLGAVVKGDPRSHKARRGAVGGFLEEWDEETQRFALDVLGSRNYSAVFSVADS